MQAARVRKVSFVPPPDAADGAVTSLAYDPGTHIQSTVYAGTNVEQVRPGTPLHAPSSEFLMARCMLDCMQAQRREYGNTSKTINSKSKLGLATLVNHLAPAGLQALYVLISGLAWA